MVIGRRLRVASTILRCSFFGFAKNERDNIDDEELAELRAAAGSWLTAHKTLIELALTQGLLIEVKNDG